ncbi:potassium channel family protein [Rhodopila sp.]|uniref:potassium channel family protein n=1 Tax=Rhodopila sp. TaxID=2480087 RepID=UPI002BF33D7F|nr:potassium channel protein [Rhodopila sp.]HVZ09437.1 potassium channel protein [Rhodopila sp.]
MDSSSGVMHAATDWLQHSPVRNLILGVIYMLVVMALATACYVAAGWHLADAFYMVIITVYTVGYGETIPVNTPLLRGITIGTIILGCTGMLYLTGALIQFITLNEINTVLGSRRMSKQIDHLRNHVIICGFGRLGVMLARELHAASTPFVIIEQAEARIEEARDLGYLYLQADATEETILLAAGVRRAATLATVLPQDAANVYITLSAHSLNPQLEIIARGELPSTESKLLQAGASKVVLPAHIGAERIAEMILFRKTPGFLPGTDQAEDVERMLRQLGLDADTIIAAPDSPMVGKTVAAVEAQAGGAFFIVQITRRTGQVLLRPDAMTEVEPGDGLFLVGRGPMVRAAIDVFEGPVTAAPAS